MSAFPPPVAKPSSPGAGKTAIADTTSAWVNVRTGPGTQYQDVGDIYDNTLVTYYPETRIGDWVWAEQGRQAGWVHTAFVQFIDVITQRPPAEQRATPYDNQIGLWYWRGDALPYQSIEQLIADIKSKAPAVNALWVKTSDGVDWMSRFDTREALAISGPESIARWIAVLNNNGMAFHAWCVPKGENLELETDRIIQTCLVSGVKSLILDVEPYRGFWSGGRDVIRPYMLRIRRALPADFHIGMAVDPRAHHFNSIFPDEWFPFINSVHPMVYWGEFRRPLASVLEETYRVWGNYGRPIIPALQADTPPDDMSSAQTLATTLYGSRGISWWRLGISNAQQWAAINKPLVDQPDVPDDQPPTGFDSEQIIAPEQEGFRCGSYTGKQEFQSFDGTWGWKVFYKTTQPRTSNVWAQWRPTIQRSGLYEIAIFVPARNATTQNARYRIDGVTGESGQLLVTLDQSKHRNVWVTLGVFELNKATPNAGVVALTDLTGESDRSIAFDAVRFRRMTSAAYPAQSARGDLIIDGIYVADGMDMPIGTPPERQGEKVWPEGWTDAAPYAQLYLVGTPREAYHTGADLNYGSPYEDKALPVYAPASGIVIFAAWLRPWGNLVVIRHDPLRTPTGRVVYTRFGHVQALRVKVGDRVRRGDQIAEIGDGGGAYIPHLHYDISGTHVLATNPGDWPGKDLKRLLKDYLDPLDFTRANRPNRG